jgi:hypothetical protein
MVTVPLVMLAAIPVGAAVAPVDASIMIVVAPVTMVMPPIAPIDTSIVVAVAPVMMASIAPINLAIVVAIAPAAVAALLPTVVALVPAMMVLVTMVVLVMVTMVSVVTPILRIGSLGSEPQSDDGGDQSGDDLPSHGPPRFLQTWELHCSPRRFFVDLNVAIDLVRSGSRSGKDGGRLWRTGDLLHVLCGKLSGRYCAVSARCARSFFARTSQQKIRA